jgi:predicted transcriptional regulator
VNARGLSSFLFEIASNERLEILAAVLEGPRKHSEIARRLSMTGSETTRHLARLVSAGLVEKGPNGAYGPTPLAELVWAGLPFLDFAHEHRDYVRRHRLLALDPAFVARLGELAHGSFNEGAYQVIAVQEAALRAVRRRAWIVTVQRFEQAIPILRAKHEAGADVRVVRPRPLVDEERRGGRDVRRNFPLRLLPRVDLFLAVLDDQAGVCLPSLDGTVDMTTMILLTDPGGLRWAEDLFLRLWDRAQDSRTIGGPR